MSGLTFDTHGVLKRFDTVYSRYELTDCGISLRLDDGDGDVVGAGRSGTDESIEGTALTSVVIITSSTK